MSFDRLATHYCWMERLLAGRKLQRCRTAFLDQLPPPTHALLLGEGHGCFIVELLRCFPEARITCVEASRGMIAQTERRLELSRLDTRNIRFLATDILDWQPPWAEFDLVVSHFFLDCFPPEQLRLIAQKIGMAAAPGARWLVADFREPASGFFKWRARLILRSMYWFFRRAADLPAKELTPPERFLQNSGFQLRERRTYEWGLLHTDIWLKSALS